MYHTIYTPQEATTNPRLILAAAGMKEYKQVVNDAVKHAKNKEG